MISLIADTFNILHKIKILNFNELTLNLDNNKSVQKLLEIIATASSLKVIVLGNMLGRKVNFEITYSVAESNG